MVEVEFADQGLSKGNVWAGKAKQEKITVGQTLFQARKNRSESDLERISEELCIRPHFLAALEQDNFNKFPSACYAEGFLKNYAAYLGLNVTHVIAQYKQEFQGSSKKVDLVFLKVEENSYPRQQMMVSLMILSAIVLSGVWYSIQGKDSISLASLPDIADVTSDILVSATSDVEAPTPQAVPKAVEETVVLAAVEKIEQDQGYHLVQQVNATPVVAVQAETATSGATQVRLTVREDAWVRIMDAEREILVDRVLLAGEEFYLTDHKGMTLMTSNAGALSVFVDDMAVLPFGKSGEIRDNISLDKGDLPLKTAQLSH
ncbi:MAG: DUF4115 domain-containing protein [Emcibacter sp.]|nr:DUF4115 domain-containing protein [Emcibacter sp.]